RALIVYRRRQLGEPDRLRDDDAVERQGRRRERRAEDQSGEPPQDHLDAAALEELLGVPARRAQALHPAMHHRAEELGLVAETAIAGALRQARTLRRGLDAGGAVALGQEQRRRALEDLAPDLPR